MQHAVYQGEKFRLFIAKVKNMYSNYGFDKKPTNEDIAELLGVKPMQLNRYYKTTNLQRETVTKITKAFNVSEKEIWGSTDNLHDMYEGDVNRFVSEDNIAVENNRKDEVTPVPVDNYMMVEFVDLSASAGILGGSNVDLLPETKKRLVPKEFDRGNYLVVRVNGDSMVDGTDISIPDGAEILVKEYHLEPGEKLPIRGNLYVVCSREGNVFKQIVEHNTDIGYLRCHSYNPRYKDYNIPMDDVFQIFQYKKIVTMRPAIPEIE